MSINIETSNKLIGYKRMREPEFVKGLVQKAGERLSERMGKKVEIGLVQEITQGTLETMVDISRVFRTAITYNARYYEDRMRYKDDAFVFMVRVDGEPAAFCLRYFQDYFDNKTLFADELAVKEQFQKNGIGPMLMRLCLVMGHQMGYSNLVLYCDDTNGQGVNLPKYYKERLGFYDCTEELGSDDPDEQPTTAMRKKLTDESIADAVAKIKGE